MSVEIRGQELVQRLQDVIAVDHQDRELRMWLNSGDALVIARSWNGEIKVFYYDPDEANKVLI